MRVPSTAQAKRTHSSCPGDGIQNITHCVLYGKGGALAMASGFVRHRRTTVGATQNHTSRCV